jgi:hypothetical protein
MAAYDMDFPLGTFEGTPIQAFAGASNKARLHASDKCPLLRGAAPRPVTMRLDSAVLVRLCRNCGDWRSYAPFRIRGRRLPPNADRTSP